MVVVLPWVPATATTRRSAISAARAADRGMDPQALTHGLEVLRVVLADRGRDHERVDVADVAGVVADVDPGAETRSAPRWGCRRRRCH